MHGGRSTGPRTAKGLERITGRTDDAWDRLHRLYAADRRSGAQRALGSYAYVSPIIAVLLGVLVVGAARRGVTLINGTGLQVAVTLSRRSRNQQV